jgi:hypothetical protein
VASESLPTKVLRLFQNFLADPPRPRPRLDHLPFSLHLVVGATSVELFPEGPLDVLCYHQRHHRSTRHDLEYLVCVPSGAHSEEYQAYAVIQLRPEDRLPLVPLADIERRLRASYGTFVDLPNPHPLLERPTNNVLTDDDPPEGFNRVLAPKNAKVQPGRLEVAVTLDVIRRELDGVSIVSWLESAFKQPPRQGAVEHRYYLDASAGVYLVRDHFAEGKTLYRARTSDAALRPRRPGAG